MTPGRPITILIADDDEDDRLMVREALAEARLANDLRFVEDGEELLEYLRSEGRYAEEDAPRPDLLLLDLNMPRMDGREALAELRADPDLAALPVVVLTTSSAEEDIHRSYGLGANSYIRKPVTFEGFVETMRSLGQYWLQVVELPSPALR